MPYGTKKIVRDYDLNPAPQYFNPTTDQYEAATGGNGSLNVRDNLVLRDAWTGSANLNKTFATPMQYFEIVNTGVTDISFTIGTITVVVQAGIGFGSSYDPFTQVNISATNGVYQALVKA
jgi:hypothetical protein